MTTKVVYSVPTGVPGTSNQGVSGEVRFGLGMPGGSQQETSGKRNQGDRGEEEERSLLEEAMEVDTAGVSTSKGKGVEGTGKGVFRTPSPSMHAPKAGEEPWQTVGKGGRPLERAVNTVMVSDRRTAYGMKNSHWPEQKLGAGGRPQSAGQRQGQGACYVCGRLGHYAR